MLTPSLPSHMPRADPEWSRQSTDKLMELAKQFELRFLAVHDRWVGRQTVEQLKERYYTVCLAHGARSPLQKGQNGSQRPVLHHGRCCAQPAASDSIVPGCALAMAMHRCCVPGPSPLRLHPCLRLA